MESLESLESLEMEAIVRGRRPPAQRWLTGLLAAACVLLTVGGLIVVTVPSAPATLGELLHGTPTPTATIALGGNLVFYVHSAPWGQLTIDGTPMSLPAALSESFLGRGRHMLDYHADPFPALHCRISTPAAASDTCPLDATFADPRGQPMGARRAVDLGATLERLPAEPRAALFASIKRMVEYTSPATTVRAGEHYSGIHGDGITLELATQPLRARIMVRLQTDGASQSSSGDPRSDCLSICLPPPSSSSETDAPSTTLEVWAHIKEGYHYTTLDGKVVLDYAPLRQIQQSAWRPDEIVSVRVGWDGAWLVSSAEPAENRPQNLPCLVGQSDFNGGGGSTVPPLVSAPPLERYAASLIASVPRSGWEVTGIRSAPNPTDGCLVVVRGGGAGISPQGPPVLFLERFGVLLAVGEDAHQVRLDFPIASINEAAEAYTIAAEGPLP